MLKIDYNSHSKNFQIDNSYQWFWSKYVKKLYLCGAVSHNDNYKQDFVEAKAKLKKAGFAVTCPTDFCNEKDAWEVALRKCIKKLVDHQYLALIPSDKFSDGRKLELHNAKKLKIEIKTVGEWIMSSETNITQETEDEL